MDLTEFRLMIEKQDFALFYENFLEEAKNIGFISAKAISFYEKKFIVCAFPYKDLQDQTIPFQNAGYIAPFAQRNYYRESVKRLKNIVKKIRQIYGGEKSDYRIFCNSQLDEKKIANDSGLGFLGRNSLVIIPEIGSSFVISAITIPFSLEKNYKNSTKNTTLFPLCENCDKNTPPCVKACPTNALKGDGKVILDRCIQWYASGNGDFIPENIAKNWGNRLYGCTNCQDACIYNKKLMQGIDSNEGSLPAYIDIQKLLSMTNEEIKNFFKGTCLGFSWLGPEKIKRNAKLIMTNIQSGNLKV